MKRFFDFTLALVALIIHAPFFLLIGLAIKLDSRGPVFFRGLRMGKDAKPFHIYKFRTMVVDAPKLGGPITHRNDPRITRLGRYLRRGKIDELPQFLNVLKGEMSFVGPRPEDPRYLQYYTQRQRLVLAVRPGITSIASIRYRNEEQLLAPETWEKLYISTILPTKLDLEVNYLAMRSLAQDFLILLATVFALLKDESIFDRLSHGTVRIEQMMRRYVPWIVIDANLVLLSYILAIVFRSIGAHFDLPIAFLASVFVVAVYVATNHIFGVYHRIWRYASAQEVVILGLATSSATLVLEVTNIALPARVLPTSAVLLGGFFGFVIMSAVRYRHRLSVGARRLADNFVRLSSSRGARVLIIGAGEEGQLLAWQFQNRFPDRMYEVAGFIDDDPEKQGMSVHDVRIYGGQKMIPELVAKLHIDLIIIAIPLHRVKEPRELLTVCRATSAQIKVLPTLVEWLGQESKQLAFTDIDDDELLQRATYHVDEKVCGDLIAGKVVMVTGASGSIGSELCRQIVAYKPHQILLIDINESGLYDLMTELQTKYPNIHSTLYLCDISNIARMKKVFESTHPQIVFHVAAYKHVPILEEFPEEGIRVNVSGTRQLHQLSAANGVERFILVSSDKAVNPSNVLGMTKWLGELMVTSPHQNSLMLSAVVRFGNVLGSRGSVVPTFERQIDMGGPITVTDPNMTRYFLAIDEAVSLVIQAAAMTKGGDLYILDMGMPINIMELAHRLIRQRGLRPEQDIQIKIVGTRPGEKMSEELIARDEEQMKTSHPSIYRIRRTHPIDSRQLNIELDSMIALISDGMSTPQILAGLKSSVQILQTSSTAQASPKAVSASTDHANFEPTQSIVTSG